MARILIIDDEEGIRFTFKRFLTAGGHDVQTANNYDEALDLISKSDFDVVFADIILSGKSGIDILRDIKKRGLTCPVIMITGYPNVDTASEAIRLGAFDYLPKPIQKDQLFHLIDVALQHKRVIDEREKYRANLEAIFRSVKDAIISVDKDMRILEVNDSAGNICGITRLHLGKKINEITRDCRAQCIHALRQTIELRDTVELHDIRCDNKRNNGQIISLTTYPLIDRLQQFSGAIMIIRDMTRLSALEKELEERQHFHRIVGKSKKMQEVYSLIELLADVETTVLITGESGTGKELVAEALHYMGARSNGPLVKVNCSALSENLLESELFGHVKGAFTGAIKDKVGRFEIADGGTIFLDEIGDISPKIQVELLRVLEEKEFERVGDSTTIKVDVRVVTATNHDLSEKVKRGEFREDLYYRLNVMKIMVPPLRERKEDIPLLVEYFMKKFNNKFRKNIMEVAPDVERILMSYNWPGNVRELEHAIEHAFILCRDSTIRVEHLPEEILKDRPLEVEFINSDIDDPKVIRKALERAGWNKTRAAELLGISRRSIYRKMKEFNIKPEKSSPV